MSADVRLMRWPDRDRADFEKLAAALGRVRAAVEVRGDFSLPAVPEAASELDRARALQRQEALRRTESGSDADLFGDPAWNLLLAAFVAAGEGWRLDLARAAEATGAMPIASRRWVRALAERGLVVVEREHVVLAERGTTLVRAGLASL